MSLYFNKEILVKYVEEILTEHNKRIFNIYDTVPVVNFTNEEFEVVLNWTSDGLKEKPISQIYLEFDLCLKEEGRYLNSIKEKLTGLNKNGLQLILKNDEIYCLRRGLSVKQ